MTTLAAYLATSVDLGPALTQIGIGALIAVPAYAILWKLWQRYEALLLDNSRLQEAQVTRERELSDKTVPVLGECVRVLTAVARATEEEAMMRRVEEQIAKRGTTS